MNKAIKNTILSSIFIVPMASIIPIHGTIIWYPQLLALMALGFVCVAMLFWENNKFISLFLIYATFSYLFVCGQSPRSMLCLITGCGGILFSYLVSKNTPSNIYKFLAVFSIINFVFVIMQLFRIDPIFTAQSNLLMDSAVGFLGSRNQVGIFHACMGTMLLSLSPWCVLLAFPIFIVKCSSALLGISVGAISYFLLSRKAILTVVASFLILISIPIFIHLKGNLGGEFKERMQVWTLSIEQIVSGKLDAYEYKQGSAALINHRKVLANPIFGFGIGNFFVYSPPSQVGYSFSPWHRYEHAHNDLIEGFFEFGYAGLLLIFLCISIIISDFISCINKTKGLIASFCGLISMAVCSLGVYIFHAPVSLFLFCLVLGIFYGEINNAKQSKIT